MSKPVLRPQQKHLLSAAENIRDASIRFQTARRQLEAAEMDEDGLSYIRQTEAHLLELAGEIKRVADAATEHNQPFELVLRVVES